MNKYIICLPILIICSLFLFSCDNLSSRQTKEVQTNNIKVTDALNNEVVLEKPVEKIICLYEPGLDALYMLHAESKLTGIYNDVYTSKELFPFYSKMDDRIAKKELPEAGINNGANIERIIQLAPDLVLMHAGQEDAVKTLKNAGIQVYAINANSKKEVIKTVTDIAALTGKKERGEELLAYVEKKVEEMKKHSENVEKRRRVYFAWAYGRVFSTTGTNSMMHACLEMAGVENVCPFEVDQPNINAETLIGWNPDMIVMWNDSPDLFYRRKEFSEILAVKERQIFNLLPMYFYNPHTLKALCTATAIHQWAYPNKEGNSAQQVEQVLIQLYGKEKTDKIIALL